MGSRSDRYRLAVYTAFAQSAKQHNLRWVVAHGSEGYPETIGRDLDALCFDRDNMALAVRLFREVAEQHCDTRWVVETSPVWGWRILAISKRFEVAELHLLFRLNSGMLDCPVDWENVTDELFPHSERVTQFKSVVMPLLGGSQKVLSVSKEVMDSQPWPLRRIYRKIASDKTVGNMDKLLVYVTQGCNPVRMWHNLRYSHLKTQSAYHSQTVPLVQLVDKRFMDAIEEKLGEIFLKVKCGDNMDGKAIARLQALQYLVCLTDSHQDAFLISDLSYTSLCRLVDEFSRYNEERSALYAIQREQLLEY